MQARWLSHTGMIGKTCKYLCSPHYVPVCLCKDFNSIMSYKFFPYYTAFHYILFSIVIVDPRITIDKSAKHTFKLNSHTRDGIISLTEIFRVIIWLINSTYTCPMMGESWDSGMLNNDPSSQELVQPFFFCFLYYPRCPKYSRNCLLWAASTSVVAPH
jgi:hypothetical protein